MDKRLSKSDVVIPSCSMHLYLHQTHYNDGLILFSLIRLHQYTSSNEFEVWMFARNSVRWFHFFHFFIGSIWTDFPQLSPSCWKWSAQRPTIGLWQRFFGWHFLQERGDLPKVFHFDDTYSSLDSKTHVYGCSSVWDSHHVPFFYCFSTSSKMDHTKWYSYLITQVVFEKEHLDLSKTNKWTITCSPWMLAIKLNCLSLFRHVHGPKQIQDGYFETKYYIPT